MLNGEIQWDKEYTPEPEVWDELDAAGKGLLFDSKMKIVETNKPVEE